MDVRWVTAQCDTSRARSQDREVRDPDAGEPVLFAATTLVTYNAIMSPELLRVDPRKFRLRPLPEKSSSRNVAFCPGLLE